MINKFSKNIWYVDQNLKFFGLEMGTRMTVVKLNDSDDLLVISPIRLTHDLIEKLSQLGTVQYIVAPNKWHHLFAGDFKNHFPKATLYCAPGLEQKRKDISFDSVLDDSSKYPWSEDLEIQQIRGVPIFNEVIFFHPLSKTIIVTDLGFHICEKSPLMTRVFFKLIGTFKKFGWAKIEKLMFIRDNTKFQNSVKKILKWDFEKIMTTHGEPVTRRGKLHFKNAFSDSHPASRKK